MKEFNFHFETRQEYIKACNAERMKIEKLAKELKEKETKKTTDIASSPKNFKSKQGETSKSSLSQPPERVNLTKPQIVNQSQPNLNSNMMQNNQRSSFTMPNTNNNFMNNRF